MNTQDKTYTKEQHELIAELCAEYGLESDQIVFFENDPEPLFDREATAVMLHRLTDVAGIEDDIVPAASGDSIAAKYRITFKDGTFAASTGVANINESLTFEQLRSVAIGRAVRSALRNKGINLLKLHNQRKAGNVASPEFSGPPLTERQRLVREVHALGQETGLIWCSTSSDKETEHEEKAGWYAVLESRYGRRASNDLDDEQLRDFAAFLRSQLPPSKIAA